MPKVSRVRFHEHKGFRIQIKGTNNFLFSDLQIMQISINVIQTIATNTP